MYYVPEIQLGRNNRRDVLCNFLYGFLACILVSRLISSFSNLVIFSRICRNHISPIQKPFYYTTHTGILLGDTI
ncbi:hypothetical protein L1887_08968 [Cichorium endivia]|nr:hypothetical protein L1887_08968 [Cichorium endivia]